MELKVGGRKVHAATGGRPFDRNQPVAMFLHGSGCDHTVWQLQARWFAWHGYSVLAPDLPGHGCSVGPALGSIAEMAAWAGALLDEAKIETAALIGHSMGGSMAVEAAAALGPRIERIALIGTAPAIPVSPDLLAAARETPERAYRMMTGWAHGHAAKLGGSPVPGLWMSGGTLALFARNAPGVLHNDLSACNAWSSGPDAARKVRCPTLVILAANDVMTPAKKGAEFVGLIAGSRTVTVQDCGHMLMTEKPDTVLDALIDFFPAR